MDSNFRHFERAAEGRRNQIRISHFERDFVSLVTCLHMIRTVRPYEQICGMGCSRELVGSGWIAVLAWS
jgi:hypothetical protein